MLVAVGGIGWWLFRPLPVKPIPASFHLYDLAEGRFVPLEAPAEIFAVGLSYAAHIEETASEFDPLASPPVFRKHPRSFTRTGTRVTMPDTASLVAAAEELEPGIGAKLRDHDLTPVSLLDYEGELGFVLLDDIDPDALAKPDFIPQIGFFIANDLSARSLAILGEGMPNRYDYWGISKSFPGFMPAGDRAWVPDRAVANGIPPITIETRVDGELRQRQSVTGLVYTPLRMLRSIHAAFPDSPLRKGTMILTGTPGGVAIKSPRWQVRLANLLGMSRFKKLSIKQGSDTSSFLDPGERVEVTGGPLGTVEVTIEDPLARDAKVAR